MATGNSHVDITAAVIAVLGQLRSGEDPDVWLALSRETTKKDRAVANAMIEQFIDQYRGAPPEEITALIDELTVAGATAGLWESLGIIPPVPPSEPPKRSPEDEAKWWEDRP